MDEPRGHPLGLEHAIQIKRMLHGDPIVLLAVRDQRRRAVGACVGRGVMAVERRLYAGQVPRLAADIPLEALGDVGGALVARRPKNVLLYGGKSCRGRWRRSTSRSNGCELILSLVPDQLTTVP